MKNGLNIVFDNLWVSVLSLVASVVFSFWMWRNSNPDIQIDAIRAFPFKEVAIPSCLAAVAAFLIEQAVRIRISAASTDERVKKVEEALDAIDNALDSGAIVKTAKKERDAYVLACEPWKRSQSPKIHMPDSNPKTHLFSLVRGSHRENFQNLLMSEQYIDWMAEVRKKVTSQDRILIIPDRLQYPIAPVAFARLCESHDIRTHPYSKSEFYKAVGQIESFNDRWNTVKLLGDTCRMHECMKLAMEILDGHPNFFVYSKDDSLNVSKSRILPRENDMSWFVQYEAGNRFVSIPESGHSASTVQKYDMDNVHHVSALIVLTFFQIATSQRQGVDAVNQISSQTSYPPNPFVSRHDHAPPGWWLERIGEFK